VPWLRVTGHGAPLLMAIACWLLLTGGVAICYLHCCLQFAATIFLTQDWDVVAHSPGDIAAVAVLRPKSFHLEAKDGASAVQPHDAEVIEVPAGA
jgi:hypothetical protein